MWCVWVCKKKDVTEKRERGVQEKHAALPRAVWVIKSLIQLIKLAFGLKKNHIRLLLRCNWGRTEEEKMPAN